MIMIKATLFLLAFFLKVAALLTQNLLINLMRPYSPLLQNMKKTVVTITGIRPDFIRMCFVFKELDKNFNHILIHTGQHYDMKLSEVFFKQFCRESSNRQKYLSFHANACACINYNGNNRVYSIQII